MEELVNEISKYRYFSTIDLKSAYHLVPLRNEEKDFTSFEANGKLYRFNRLSFGLTNGVSCFQRIMNNLISQHNLKATFSYLDDVTVCGSTKEEHDYNLKIFMDMAKSVNLTLNQEKCIFGIQEIHLLGYLIKHNELRPDPERARPLMEMPIPSDPRGLARLIGLFSYYSKWIPKFSSKLAHINSSSLPLNVAAKEAIRIMKNDISRAVLLRINPDLKFTVETDASDYAIGATLSQEGRPVAFFSRTLSPTERKYCSYEKEAYAIIESVKRWRHFLSCRHFALITDQRSVSFMFDVKHRNKIKNDKILRWRVELSPYSYDLIYRPGRLNQAADAFSRVCASSSSIKDLFSLHKNLCHPGVARLFHYVKSKNLPFSLSDVKNICSDCATCKSLKPSFYKPPAAELVKALKPFDRISLDFKGPLPSRTLNRYLLVVVDEYSRFPFAYPCSDISASTVTRCLSSLFSLFGTPSYVHSDRGTAFMSSEMTTFLRRHQISSSRSTPYHPTGNSQCERYVGLIWKTILLALKDRHLSVSDWETVLPDALHCLRTLLCTSTNSTPHDRLFSFPRRSSIGPSLPSWLSDGEVALLRKYVRTGSAPLTEEVQLLHVNPHYATVRFSNGREDTVSTSDLSPRGVLSSEESSISNNSYDLGDAEGPEEAAIDVDLSEGQHDASKTPSSGDLSIDESAGPRRSLRSSKPIERLQYSKLGGGE